MVNKLNLKKQDLLDFCHSCIDEWRLNTRANFKYIVAMELMIGAVKISSEDVMKTLWTKILVWFNDLQWKNALAEKELKIEQGKSQFEIQRMQTEAQIKRELMAEEFNYQMQLEQMKKNQEIQREQEIEDRKDNRTRIAGTQQSQMISQRQNNEMPKDFENDPRQIEKLRSVVDRGLRTLSTIKTTPEVF